MLASISPKLACWHQRQFEYVEQFDFLCTSTNDFETQRWVECDWSENLEVYLLGTNLTSRLLSSESTGI